MDLDFEELLHDVTGMVGISDEFLYKLLVTVLALAPIIFLRRYLKARVAAQIEDPSRRYLANKALNYATGLLFFVIPVIIWLKSGAGFATYFGFISAGLAVALQTPISNIAGWLFLVVKKPFELGDRVQINGLAGDVIDISLFSFSLLEIGNWVDADQSTGRITHIPNGQIFSQALHNYTQSFQFIWNEISVTFTFESNWRKAKEILSEIVKAHTKIQSQEASRQIRQASNRYMITWTHLTPIVWTSVADNGVVLTIRYLCDPRRRRGTESGIWEDILSQFEKHDDIDYAYPSIRYYNNRLEGKPLAGGPQSPQNTSHGMLSP